MEVRRRPREGPRGAAAGRGAGAGNHLGRGRPARPRSRAGLGLPEVVRGSVRRRRVQHERDGAGHRHLAGRHLRAQGRRHRLVGACRHRVLPGRALVGRCARQLLRQRPHQLYQYDLEYPGGSLWLDRKLSDKTTLRLQTDVNYAWYGYQPYVVVGGISPQIFHSWDEYGVTWGYAKFYGSDYFFDTFDLPDGIGPPGVNEAAERNRDGWGVIAGFQHTLPVPQADLALRGGFNYYHYDSQGTEWRYNGYEVMLGFTKPLPWQFVLDGQASYLYQPFQNPSTYPENTTLPLQFESANRRDSVWQFQVSLERPITPVAEGVGPLLLPGQRLQHGLLRLPPADLGRLPDGLLEPGLSRQVMRGRTAGQGADGRAAWRADRQPDGLPAPPRTARSVPRVTEVPFRVTHLRESHAPAHPGRSRSMSISSPLATPRPGRRLWRRNRRALGVPTHAAESGSSPPSISASDECEVGQVREGERCMHRVAPPGACAAGGGAQAGGGGGGGCFLIGDASGRFSPSDVAAGPGPAGFSPGPPGPNQGPLLQPGDITPTVVSAGGLTPPGQAPTFRPVQLPPRPDRP